MNTEEIFELGYKAAYFPLCKDMHWFGVYCWKEGTNVNFNIIDSGSREYQETDDTICLIHHMLKMKDFLT